jgi:hypothetical protein
MRSLMESDKNKTLSGPAYAVESPVIAVRHRRFPHTNTPLPSVTADSGKFDTATTTEKSGITQLTHLTSDECAKLPVI